MECFACVHCHFYQPPRENPWLEAVESQDSASPYHDWNERIARECYLPNGASRILDSEHRIAKIVNNYARISFNFGPTLLSWMEERAPECYQRILDGDRESAKLYSGHGAALAQAYNHIILPLANSRDKRTQIIWGLRDFQRRFRLDPEGDSAQLMHVATDGETYGHHHSHGDMALAYALDYIEHHKLARLTNYGEYFAAHPPTQEVRVHERSSWSCVHGVSRWERNCGCNSGGHSHWNQQWRCPLREALNWLRDDLTEAYEMESRKLIRDPWLARDEYITVVSDRSPQNVAWFLARHTVGDLRPADKTRVLRMLEMLRHLMLMYTSCGWFFDEPTGPETVQVLQYAARAVQLGQQLFGGDREEEFLKRLEAVQSNIREFGNGRAIYEKFVRPAMLDLPGVAAHYVISSFFEGFRDSNSIYSYRADLGDAQVFESGRLRLAAGSARITSRITHARLDFNFAVLHSGAHNLHAGICPLHNSFPDFIKQLRHLLSTSQLDDGLRLLNSYFGVEVYSLKSLFHDERRRIVGQIVSSTLAGLDALYRDVYDHNTALMSFLRELRLPLPPILRVSSDFVLQNAIRRSLDRDEIDFKELESLLASARQHGVELDLSLKSRFHDRLEQLMSCWAGDPFDLRSLQQIEPLVSAMGQLSFEVDLWSAQNTFFEVMATIKPVITSRIHSEWLSAFRSLAKRLGMPMSELHSSVPRTKEKEPTPAVLPIATLTGLKILSPELAQTNHKERQPGAD